MAVAAGAGGEEKSEVGEKRKRAVEPDGGHDVGLRGQGVPAIVASGNASAKKAKVDGES